MGTKGRKNVKKPKQNKEKKGIGSPNKKPEGGEARKLSNFSGNH